MELYTGPPVAHPITVRVQGDDPATLRRYADQVKDRLKKTPGAIDVTDSMSDSIPLADIEIDADRALRHGVSPAQVGATLRAIYGEDKVTSFRQDRETIEIFVEGPQAPFEALGDTPVPAAHGGVPIVAVGDVKLKHGYAELRRYNTRRVVEITADVNGATLPSAVLANVTPFLQTMKWEKGYSFAIAGEQVETERGFRQLAVAAVVTMALIFALLVLMFRSLMQSLTVLFAVPYALIGAVPALYVTNNAFGFMAFLGLVALIGVYVNHKIYFVDRMNELMRRGLPWERAILQAGVDRLRPVLLTALTAILGLLPLTLGSGALWSSFGWVNICGLVASIPLSLIVLPAFLAVLFKLRRSTHSTADAGVTQGGTLVMKPAAKAPRSARNLHLAWDVDGSTQHMPKPGNPSNPPSEAASQRRRGPAKG